MKTSEATSNLDQALSKAQAQIDPAIKNARGHGYDYAALEEVMAACMKAITDQGMCLNQGMVEKDAGRWVCVTRLAKDGEWIMTECSMIVNSSGRNVPMQELGSAYTYARRYATQALLGIAPIKKEDVERFGWGADDDGASSGVPLHPRNGNRAQNSAPQPIAMQAPAQPQQFPNLELQNFAQLMNLNPSTLPPLSGLIKRLCDGVSSAQRPITSGEVMQKARDHLENVYAKTGGTMNGNMTEEKSKAMKDVGTLASCEDLLAVCRLSDLLEAELEAGSAPRISAGA